MSGAKVEQSDPQEKPEITEKAPEENALIPEFEDGGRPRWFHVHVTDAETGKSKVRVNIPLRLVQFGLAVGKRFSPELQEFDIDELSSYMSSEKGLLVDVEDNEDGERVLIYVD